MRSYIATLFALLVFGVPAISSHFSPQVDFVARMFGDVVNQLAAVISVYDSQLAPDIYSHQNNVSVEISSSTP